MCVGNRDFDFDPPESIKDIFDIEFKMTLSDFLENFNKMKIWPEKR
jgi:hypothetical protein